MASRVAQLAAASLLALLISSCSSDTGPALVWVTALKTGDCVVVGRHKNIHEVSRVTLVPCAEPHDLEVYAQLRYSDGRRRETKELEKTAAPSSENTASDGYPGVTLVQNKAKEDCSHYFRKYLGQSETVGESPREKYKLSYLYPSAEAWTAAGSHHLNFGLLSPLVDQPPLPGRWATCVIHDPQLDLTKPKTEADQLVGSVRDAPSDAPTRTTPTSDDLALGARG